MPEKRKNLFPAPLRRIGIDKLFTRVVLGKNPEERHLRIKQLMDLKGHLRNNMDVSQRDVIEFNIDHKDEALNIRDLDGMKLVALTLNADTAGTFNLFGKKDIQTELSEEQVKNELSPLFEETYHKQCMSDLAHMDAEKLYKAYDLCVQGRNRALIGLLIVAAIYLGFDELKDGAKNTLKTFRNIINASKVVDPTDFKEGTQPDLLIPEYENVPPGGAQDKWDDGRGNNPSYEEDATLG